MRTIRTVLKQAAGTMQAARKQAEGSAIASGIPMGWEIMLLTEMNQDIQVVIPVGLLNKCPQQWREFEEK